MAASIAVIGNSDSIEYFRILGFAIYETENGELTEKQFLEVVEKRFKIILVTEEVFCKYEKLIRRRTQRTFPVVSVIPDVRGASWKGDVPFSRRIAFEEVRRAVVKAVGQDISSSEE